MEGENNQHARICVLENLFERFSNQLSSHMDAEERVFNDIKSTIDHTSKSIERNIIISQSENKVDHEKILINIKNTLEKDYVSKLELTSQMVNIERSILHHIKSAKRSAYSDILVLTVGFTSAIGISAWIYINVIKDIIHHNGL